MSKQDTIISLLKEIDANIDNVSIGGNVPKVKVYSFKVTNDCINDDGIWEGESLIDTSECTSFFRSFYSNEKIKKINADDWNTSELKNISGVFAFASNLQEINCKNWDVSNVINFDGAFRNTNVKILDISKWDVSKGQLFDGMFIYTNVPIMDFRNWNMSNATSVSIMFNLMSHTYSFVEGLTIDEVITNNVSCLNGLSLSIDISRPPLDRASLRALINGLADLTGKTAQTLTLGTTLIAKLTEEDIAIATAKNWTIA